jgi:uncharacterized Zn finger protein (UPF0148 family)
VIPEGPNEVAGIDPRLEASTADLTKPDQLTCEICGGRMIERQCKILCPNCGYTRDCSDP